MSPDPKKVGKPSRGARRGFVSTGAKAIKRSSSLGHEETGPGPRCPPSRSGPFNDDFRTSKKDKRQIKHAALMSKIEKTQKPKRRRPSKKLAANLESLADALPEAEEAGDASSQVNVIKQKTLRHKPGAMKQREKLEKVERDRFAKNMAQMSNLAPPANAGSNPDTSATTSRWSALRNFISSTMEQQPVFKANK
ncbi:hypothetical protein N7510_000222 [Penicillium lagena]|uniref:uncharacterized protein n=1 Tax=Penicillium lagena TaxID=94218 RepID=UPI00253F78D5|nr:uncharacterized protein N7510_000222 [Penicillium lagena]KAJ5623913.1 hypothetical protein N7510_000222 [Penicillium lagena]